MSSVNGFENEVMGISDNVNVPEHNMTTTETFKRKCPATETPIKDKVLPNLATAFEEFENTPNNKQVNMFGYKVDKLILNILFYSVVFLGILYFVEKSIKTPSNVKAVDSYTHKHMKTAPIYILLLSPFVFGFIDNMGMFVASDAIEGFLQKIIPDADFKTVAGISNAFSDGLGVFVSASIVAILTKVYGMSISPSPIQDAIGISLGCLAPVVMHNMGIV